MFGGYNSDPGNSDSPPGQRIRTGSQSWILQGAKTSTLIFDEIELSGWRDVAVNYHVSSTVNGTAQGHKANDYVKAFVATSEYATSSAPGFGSTPDITVTGYGNGTRWGYNSGAEPIVVNAGANASYRATTDGLQGPEGYTDFTILVPDGKRSVALKIELKNTQTAHPWNLDDVAIFGTPTTSRACVWIGGGEWNNAAGAKYWIDQSNGGALSAWNGANGDNAYFDQPGITAKITGGVTVAARSLTFNADGCTIDKGNSSSFLLLSNGGSGGPGANTIEVAQPGSVATILAVIRGNPGVGLTKTGLGTLVLGASNQFTGDLVLREGTLRVDAANRLGVAENNVVFDGGALQFSQSVDLTDFHPLVFQSGGGTIDTQGIACTVAANQWSGSGTLKKTGEGLLRLTGAGPDFSGSIDVQRGTLRLDSVEALAGCGTVNVGVGAVLDMSSVAGGCRLGASTAQKLVGAGTILGDLQIDWLGTHEIGSSPDVQHVRGNYVMDGLLQVEIGGDSPGNGITGYDQIVVEGDGTFHVSLGGELSLDWLDAEWSATERQLWIIRNDTAGDLIGEFQNYAQGAAVAQRDGLLWRIHYGANAGEQSLTGGNDVALAASAVPEPGLLGLGCPLAAALVWLAWRRRAR